MVPRRQAERLLQLRRPARRGRAAATRSRSTGKASPTATGATITYADLQREVVALRERAEGARRRRRGPPVAIYMGMVPELPVAMLACTRLGAPHTVVFGGFSADSLSDRMNDMGCEVLITQDEAWRRGTTVPLKQIADEAMADAPGVKTCVVVRRTGNDVPMTGGPRPLVPRRRAAPTTPRRARREPMDAEDLLFLMYTSGHDREAEGDRAHDRRLPRRRRDDAPLRLRPQAGHRRVLVRRRRRLDHRPQLHRLRPALQRRDVGDVRRDARLPRQGPLVVDRRALRRDDPLHGADRDPLAHEVGAGARRRSTTSRRCGCSARSASRSTRRRGSGTTSTSAAAAARSSTRGGRPRPG